MDSTAGLFSCKVFLCEKKKRQRRLKMLEGTDVTLMLLAKKHRQVIFFIIQFLLLSILVASSF